MEDGEEAQEVNSLRPGIVVSMTCPHCAAKPTSSSARFCTRCGATLKRRAGAPVLVGRLAVLPFVLLGRAMAWPIRRRRERRRWLTEASGPDSPINSVAGLSPEAKRVYTYLASVTLRYGSALSRVRTVARVAGVSENRARNAIRELEQRGLLSHQPRNTWHGRGAHDYYVKPIERG